MALFSTPSKTVIHIHFHGASDDAISSINKRLEIIMGTQAELAAQINEVTNTVAKIGVETQSLLTKVTELTDLLAAGGNTTPEVDAAIAALVAQAAVVDELVADA